MHNWIQATQVHQIWSLINQVPKVETVEIYWKNINKAKFYQMLMICNTYKIQSKGSQEVESELLYQYHF